MNKEQTIEFLKNHQPMPDDSELSEYEIEQYNLARKYFLQNPDEECIPLFLNSFGEVNGFGVYQLVEDVIIQFEQEKVVPHLIESLNSKYRSIRYWSAQIAASFPNIKLFNILENLFYEDDTDIKFAAIIALVQLALSKIKTDEVLNLLNEGLVNETDEEIIEFIQEAINDIQS